MRLFGCLGKTVLLLALIAIVGMAWLHWSSGRESIGSGSGEDPLASASPELAAEVEARLESALEEGGRTVALTETEFASLLLHGLAGRLPGGLSPTSVQFVDGEVRVGGLVALSLLPSGAWRDRIRGILPEEVPVEVRFVVLSVEDGEAVLLLRRLSLAGIPLPRSAYVTLIPELGGREPGDLPPEAMRVSLPPEIQSVYIDEDRLIVGIPQ